MLGKKEVAEEGKRPSLPALWSLGATPAGPTPGEGPQVMSSIPAAGEGSSKAFEPPPAWQENSASPICSM